MSLIIPRSLRAFALPFIALTPLLIGAPPAAAQDPAPDLSGIWIFTVVTENGTGTPTVTLTQDGDAITGTYSSQRMGTRRLAGTVKGDTLTFRLAADPSADVTMTFIGTIQPDGSLEGFVDFGGMGGANFTARRQPPGTSLKPLIRAR
jgi:hypothetical protein